MAAAAGYMVARVLGAAPVLADSIVDQLASSSDRAIDAGERPARYTACSRESIPCACTRFLRHFQQHVVSLVDESAPFQAKTADASELFCVLVKNMECCPALSVTPAGSWCKLACKLCLGAPLASNCWSRHLADAGLAAATQ